MAIIFGTPAADTLTGSADRDEIYGFDGNDTLDGGDFPDTLVGGAGVDTMRGGQGYDTYYVDDARDVIIDSFELSGGEVITSVDYELPPANNYIRAMFATAGTAPINLTGSTGPERLVGNEGPNRIDGGVPFQTGSRDQLEGLGGNDTYIVYGSNNRVRENSGQGNDVALVAFSPLSPNENQYSLIDVRETEYNAELETLAMADPSSTRTFSLTGNEFAQTLIGNAGANTLTGNGGLDTLIGLGGDDYYLLEFGTTVDIIVEAAGGGTDAASVPSGYVLPAGAEVEILYALGFSGGNVTGNGFSQRIFGTGGADLINGLGGADTLVGQTGNDTYLVRGSGDQVLEDNGGGVDTVFTTVSYSLGVNEVEVLSTVTNADTTAINLTGNFASQRVIGNYGDNVLNGGSGGVDTLIGLRGNDIYAVGDSRVDVIENAGEGNDTVVTSVDYALDPGMFVEVLAVQNRAATNAINLFGNELAQTIAGNEGANYIDGGSGADVLIGGGGADMFAFTTGLGGGNVDAITDFQLGTDRIGLFNAVFNVGPDGVTSSNFVNGPAALDSDDRILFSQATGQLFYDADGNGAGAALAFAVVTPGLALSASSFDVLVPAVA